jgi:hypothetical protein
LKLEGGSNDLKKKLAEEDKSEAMIETTRREGVSYVYLIWWRGSNGSNIKSLSNNTNNGESNKVD